MMMSGKDLLKSHILIWQQNVYSEWEDVTSSSRAFQVFGPAESTSREMAVIIKSNSSVPSSLSENYL